VRHNPPFCPFLCQIFTVYQNFFAGRLHNKPCLILLLKISPHLKYVTTLLCNLPLIAALVCDCRSFSVYRYQKKCDQLEVSNVEFRDKFEQLEENKKDIVAFIKKKLDEKGMSFS